MGQHESHWTEIDSRTNDWCSPGCVSPCSKNVQIFLCVPILKLVMKFSPLLKILITINPQKRRFHPVQQIPCGQMWWSHLTTNSLLGQSESHLRFIKCSGDAPTFVPHSGEACTHLVALDLLCNGSRTAGPKCRTIGKVSHNTLKKGQWGAVWPGTVWFDSQHWSRKSKLLCYCLFYCHNYLAY